MASATAVSQSSFVLASPAFADGGWIPSLHSPSGLNLSPPLRWHGEPQQTGSYALVLEDPDAPGGTWIHWVLFNIPAGLHGLPLGLERHPELANGARHGCCWGIDRFERLGYQGPQPPAGESHRYRFRIHALKTALPLVPGCSIHDLNAAMAGQILDRAEITGLYGSEPRGALGDQNGRGLRAPVVSTEPAQSRDEDR